MFAAPNGPVIPERTSARTSSSPSTQGRRRRSLPATSHRNDRRRDSNCVSVKPASTEVISSLIETLSAISSPAEHHFDSLPRISASHSTPASPRPWQTDHPTISEPPEKEMHRSSLLNRPHGVDAAFFLHPDRASTRTSSPRGSSARIEQALRTGPTEPEDPYDLSGIYSIGNVSIESKPWQSTTSINSTGSDAPRSIRSLRSMRSLKSLGFKSSRDSLRSGDERVFRSSKRDWNHKPERLVIADSTPPQSPLPGHITMAKRNDRQNVIGETPHVSQRSSSVQSRNTPRRPYANADDARSDTKSPYISFSQDRIPSRDSSKHYSIRSSEIHQKALLRQAEHDNFDEGTIASAEKVNTTVQGAHGIKPKEPTLEVESPPEAAEDVVTRRIKELKERKMERERSSIETRAQYVPPPETLVGTVSSPTPAEDSSLADAHFPTAVNGLPLAKAIEINNAQEDEHSAPSPAIASRIKRDGLVGSRPLRDPFTPASAENKRRSFSTPHRSNSRLLRRLSRSTSPTTAAKHRRTFSNPVIDPLFDQLEWEDGDSIGDAVDDFLASPRLNQIISHAQTGRKISFSEVGDPKGSVVFCCVGMGLTRFLTAFYDELASTLRLRLITPDRPGVGGSEPYADGLDTPLGWPDDVRAICEHLKITKFSIMAHSAGAIYALATALRMSQHIRCRIHLLAPWIPPSQMSVIGAQQEPLPTNALPYSQRILRALPTTFLRAANSSFLSTTSASITTSLPKSPRRNKQRTGRSDTLAPDRLDEVKAESRGDASMPAKTQRNEASDDSFKENRPPLVKRSTSGNPIMLVDGEKDRGASYETRLTEAIWEAATTGANPAVDLLVCLERRQAIGFRYVDITRAVVIHHGSKDTRVPVENAKWLGKTMRKCEVRVLEGEGHGLMASAGVMGNVLMEMAQEWDDWNRLVNKKKGMERRVTNAV